MIIDYTCSTYGRDHPPAPSYPSHCPFGSPRAPKPDRTSTEAEQRQAAMAAIQLRDQLETRQRQADRDTRERRWAKVSAQLKEVMTAYRQEVRAEREATSAAAHELLIGVRRGQAWEQRSE